MSRKPPIQSPGPQCYALDDFEGSMATRGTNLFFSGEISNKFLAFICEHLAKFGEEKHKKTRLVLNSFGGDCYAAFAAVDFMEQVPELTTIATGCCMSAAVPIIAAGKKGSRYATHRTRFMLHTSWATYEDRVYADYLKRELTEFQHVGEVYASILARHCGTYDTEWWSKHVNTDPCWYLSAEEAVDLGIIDAVIEDPFSGQEKVRNRPSKKKTSKKKKTKKRAR